MSPKAFQLSLLKSYVKNPEEIMKFMQSKGIMQVKDEEYYTEKIRSQINTEREREESQ